ncbi:MAG: LacI family DNA-binding transcriptional regulator [Verrucomicrobiota bacterium]|nr:LacI family DNA-binding transcriptional regulator [Verrucomicrobiota bacterium]
MVTIRQVAEQAGVSIMTVSKVMNDASDISVKTKERVKALAVTMGYRTNPIARGLRVKSLSTIGVVIPSLTEEHMAEVVSGICKIVGSKNFKVLIEQSFSSAEEETKAVGRLIDSRVDGIILCSSPRLSRFYDIFDLSSKNGVPMVLIDRYPPNAPGMNIPFVVTDDRAGGFMATQHLISLGHRNILFLTGPAGVSSSEERKEGYRKAMIESGCEDVDKFIFSAGFDVNSGKTAMLQALDEGVKFSGIFAVNDHVAIGACEVLLAQNIKLPEEVSVIGYGNLKMGEFYKVPLTTIHQPRADIAQIAVNLLWDRLEKQPVEVRRLPVELITRASAGPVA